MKDLLGFCFHFLFSFPVFSMFPVFHDFVKEIVRTGNENRKQVFLIFTVSFTKS